MLLIALTACGAPPAPLPPVAAVDPTALADFQREREAWRAQRRAELLAPEGWLSLTGLHWIEPGAHYVGRARDNGIRLAVGPAQLGLLERRDGKMRFVAYAQGKARVEGSGARLLTDRDPGGPTRIAFDGGRGVATVIRRGDRYALRVRHADSPARSRFGGLAYWPGGPDWIVEGRFLPHPAGKTIEIADIVGTLQPLPNPGRVVFRRDGRDFVLEALEGEDGGLFLVFADRTSGHGSYGAGRFLDTARPGPGGRVSLDFNRAYNPPCAFTPFATCPLPPPENRLDLRIAAGEKTYTVPD
jgi:uncharacterized protein (DUF1684 family)